MVSQSFLIQASKILLVLQICLLSPLSGKTQPSELRDHMYFRCLNYSSGKKMSVGRGIRSKVSESQSAVTEEIMNRLSLAQQLSSIISTQFSYSTKVHSLLIDSPPVLPMMRPWQAGNFITAFSCPMYGVGNHIELFNKSHTTVMGHATTS